MDLDHPFLATAVDIETSALDMVKQNYFLHRFAINPQTKLKFKETDRLSGLKEKYDLIVSNPPYIKRVKDYSLVHENVVKFEPHTALFLDDEDYFSWFETLFEQVFNHLEEGGAFMMEGHENHLESLQESIGRFPFKEVRIDKDLSGANRFIVACK